MTRTTLQIVSQVPVDILIASTKGWDSDNENNSFQQTVKQHY
jgi:hypothetical protein